MKTKLLNNPRIQPTNLHWRDDLSVQELLDVVASIIADEYIEIAKKNKDVFLNKGGQK